jgi:putative lipoprotein
MTYFCLFLITGCVQQQYQPIVSNSPYSIASSKQLPDTMPVIQSSTSTVNTRENISIVPAKYSNFSGIVTITAQQRTMRLCHTDQVFNLQPNDHLITQIKRLNQATAYIEFEGQINQSLNPLHQRAIISVEELHYLSGQKENSCRPQSSQPNFEISGSQPDWTGYAQENQYTFIIKDLNSKWTIKRSAITKGLRAFVETENSEGEQLDLSFTGNGCIDSSNNYWQYGTRLYLKGKQITGCGKYPNQHDDTQAWLGHYRYKNDNVTIELNLAKHQRANVKYQYSNGNIQTSSGYWHLYGSSGLKLLLTQHQGNKANVVYHFRRDGVRLQAGQQWRDNQKYSFNGALLTLDRMTDEVESASFTTVNINDTAREFQAQNIISPRISTPAINNTIKRYFAMHKTKTDNSKYWFSEYDLNDNGSKDLLVMLDWCEGDGCVLLVFEKDLNSYKFISRIAQVQAPLQISKTKQHQWQSILIKNKQQWLQLDFDGISYPASAETNQLVTETNFTQVKLFTTALTEDNAIAIE